jgi:hypothetical protein
MLPLAALFLPLDGIGRRWPESTPKSPFPPQVLTAAAIKFLAAGLSPVKPAPPVSSW